MLREFVGRPTPLTPAHRLTEAWGGAQVWLKREDLAHTGAHKINNTLGQVLLARRMGKKRIIAETGAGQHGVATATACALFGLPCEVYMGALDVERQALNVFRMRALGAVVRPVESGSRTLKDAMNEAMRDWVSQVQDTYYVIGSAAGPHPYPTIVRDFQSVIGQEVRAQTLAAFGPAAGRHHRVRGRRLERHRRAAPLHRGHGRAARGRGGRRATGSTRGQHGASLTLGTEGVLHGSRSLVLQDENGQIQEAHSISAGLDYPGVGPELAHLAKTGRMEVRTATDDEALARLLRGGAHGGHPPRAGDVARVRARRASWPASWARASTWSSTARAGATRTWRPSSARGVPPATGVKS